MIKDFKIFDLISANNRPDDLGMLKTMHQAYAWHLYGGNDVPDPDYTKEPTDFFRDEYPAKYGLVDNPPEYLSIDLEKFKYDDRKERIDALEDVVSTFKTLKLAHQGFPHSKIGWYDLGPISTQSWALTQDIVTEENHTEWQRQNDNMEILLGYVDWMNPAMYYYQSYGVDGWKRKALAHVKECRRLNPTAPIYIQIMPKVLGGDNSEPYMTYEMWSSLLEWCHVHVEGVVIWTHRTRSKLVDWDESAPWWLATQEFLKAVNR